MGATTDKRIPQDRSLIGDLALLGISAIGLAMVLLLAFSDLGISRSDDSKSDVAIATLKMTTNRVRVRLQGLLVWNDARTGDGIHEKDAVYVAADSEAIVSFARDP